MNGMIVSFTQNEKNCWNNFAYLCEKNLFLVKYCKRWGGVETDCQRWMHYLLYHDATCTMGASCLTSMLASRMASEPSTGSKEKHAEFLWHSLSQNSCTHNPDRVAYLGFLLVLYVLKPSIS